MYKQNIANFILYNLAHTDMYQGANINKGLISDVVEGGNREIYVTPNQPIRVNKNKTKKNLLM